MPSQAEAAINGDHPDNSSLAHTPHRSSPMGPQNHRKRQRNTGDNRPQPSKKLKSSTVKAQQRDPPNFPPEFWDNLTEISLTPRALREFDRRAALETPLGIRGAGDKAVVLISSVDLARFARHGGPDLTDLRNFPDQRETSGAHSSHSLSMATSTTHKAKSKRSSAYDKNFEKHLIQNGIYPEGYEYPGNEAPEPNNLEEISERLAARRASLSPSRFPSSTFKSFKVNSSRVLSEGSVMSDLLPTIRGDTTPSIPNEGTLAFNNLESLTDETTVSAVPDRYDGAIARDVPEKIRTDLDKMIVPSGHARAPIVPNFFLEAKSPTGGADVARRQACLDGAIGARAIHSLRNYQSDAICDGNAYSLSTTYHAGTGTLQMYAHHVLPSTEDPSRLEYHMTQVDGWQITGNINSFRRGAAAYRNARDLAKEFRDDAIRTATSRLNRENATENIQVSSEWQDAHDLLQNQIADESSNESDEEDSDSKDNEYDKEDTENDGDEQNDELQLSQRGSQQTLGQPARHLKRGSNKIS